MKKEYGEPLMKIKYGEYTDVSGYLGPTRMLGFFGSGISDWRCNVVVFICYNFFY